METIADLSGQNQSAIRQRMKTWGITPTRKRPKTAGDLEPLTYELLERMRFQENKTIIEIANELGYSRKRVRHALRRHGLAFDYHEPLANRLGAGELWFLHHEQGLSTESIASRFATSASAVRRRMNEVDVKVEFRKSTRSPRQKRPKTIPPPDLQLLDELDAEVASRPRQLREKGIDTLSAKEFRRLHHDEKLSMKEIAKRYNTAIRFVMQRANELGIEIRIRRGTNQRKGRTLSDSDLQRRNDLCRLPDVRKALRRHKINGVSDDPTPVVDLSEAMLTDLYEDCQLNADEIAILCVRSRVTLSAGLRRHGIEIRPAHLPHPSKAIKQRLTRKRLENQLAKDIPLDNIAKRFGYKTVTSLRIVANALQVDLDQNSTPKAPAAVLREIRDAGIDSAHAEIVLSPLHHGKGSYSSTPPWPGPPGPALLQYLFNDLGLSKHEIASRLHASWETMMQAFDSAGISPYRHTHPKPFGQWSLDPDELRKLSEEGMSARQIANHLGVSNTLVLRAMHRHHLPVRKGGSDDTYIRFDVLIGDRRITRALAQAKVPIAGINPPSRGPLPIPLLDTLLNQLALSTFDIELLTGRTAEAVRRDAQQADIWRRS